MRTAPEAHLRGEDYIDVTISKGRELIREKKEAEAETLLTEVMQQFPNKAEVYLLLGEISTSGFEACPGQRDPSERHREVSGRRGLCI